MLTKQNINYKKKKKRDTKLSEFSYGVKVLGNSERDLIFALNEFKKLVKNSKKLLEYQERQEFVKPSTKKRRQKQLAIRRRERNL